MMVYKPFTLLHMITNYLSVPLRGAERSDGATATAPVGAAALWGLLKNWRGITGTIKLPNGESKLLKCPGAPND
jgi:hypothetical protein